MWMTLTSQETNRLKFWKFREKRRKDWFGQSKPYFRDFLTSVHNYLNCRGNSNEVKSKDLTSPKSQPRQYCSIIRVRKSFFWETDQWEVLIAANYFNKIVSNTVLEPFQPVSAAPTINFVSSLLKTGKMHKLHSFSQQAPLDLDRQIYQGAQTPTTLPDPN